MLSKEQILSALNEDSISWNGNGIGNFGQPLTISFSFFSELPNYYLTDPDPLQITANFLNNEIDQNTVESLNPAQQQAFFKALLAWESVANITFVNGGADNPNATIAVAGASFKWSEELNRYPYASTQRIMTNTQDGANTRFGDLWLNTTHEPGLINQTLTEPGQDGYQTLLHEIGHALGLRHPGGFDYSQDQLHTTMSYTKANITWGGKQWYPSGPMLYDILAIQTLYGPNMQYHAFASNYTFSNDPNKPDVRALWDAGGIDTFDAGNQTKSVFINLSPGEFSSIGTGDRDKAYIAIAYNVDGVPINNYIENAIGGSGNDELIGNDGDNQLEGRKGNDYLKGGQGSDTYIYTQGDGFDTLLDTDGIGKIEWDGLAVKGSEGLAPEQLGRSGNSFSLPDISRHGNVGHKQHARPG